MHKNPIPKLSKLDTLPKKRRATFVGAAPKKAEP
jgi:hypothetical protein